MSYQKYHAKKITTSEGVFDSQKEYRRWKELSNLVAEGTISNLQRQVTYELIPKQKLPFPYKVKNRMHYSESSCKYIADFVYTYKGSVVVEDAKGFRTPEYKIKKKLMLYIHGIQIKEV